MATSALLKLEGQSQGWIKGSVIQKGREGLIEVTSWSWGAERNSQGQQPSGPATVSEFHITKRRDRATPLLLNAFKNSEEMTEWRFDLWDPSAQGAEQNTMRIELENAWLASDRYGGVDTGLSNPPDHEELTFVFETMTVTWLDGNITGVLDLGQQQ
jgi:type VI secretion system secreted protein Hcp